jgi:hypothetical protein
MGVVMDRQLKLIWMRERELKRRRGFCEPRERDGPGSEPRDARWQGGRVVQQIGDRGHCPTTAAMRTAVCRSLLPALALLALTLVRSDNPPCLDTVGQESDGTQYQWSIRGRPESHRQPVSLCSVLIAVV